MSSAPRVVDLTQVPPVPWAWVDEHVYAAIRGCSVKVLRERAAVEHGLPVPENQRSDDQVQARRHNDFHGIAARWRWRRSAVSAGKDRTWPATQILALTVPQPWARIVSRQKSAE